MEMTQTGKKLLAWLQTGHILVDLVNHYVLNGDTKYPLKLMENLNSGKRTVMVDYGGVDVDTLLNESDHFYIALEVRNVINEAKAKRYEEFKQWVNGI